MAEQEQEFAAPVLHGRRFQAHAVPVDVFESLSATDLALDGAARESAQPLSLPSKTPAPLSISFPRDIVALSDEIWRAGHIVEPLAESRYEACARIRAALIRLRTLYPQEAWPVLLFGQHKRLFGERWATSENGRGVREVLSVMRYDGRNRG